MAGLAVGVGHPHVHRPSHRPRRRDGADLRAADEDHPCGVDAAELDFAAGDEFWPVMVTAAPPESGPCPGETDSTAGATGTATLKGASLRSPSWLPAASRATTRITPWAVAWLGTVQAKLCARARQVGGDVGEICPPIRRELDIVGHYPHVVRAGPLDHHPLPRLVPSPPLGANTFTVGGVVSPTGACWMAKVPSLRSPSWLPAASRATTRITPWLVGWLGTVQVKLSPRPAGWWPGRRTSPLHWRRTSRRGPPLRRWHCFATGS